MRLKRFTTTKVNVCQRYDNRHAACRSPVVVFGRLVGRVLQELTGRRRHEQRLVQRVPSVATNHLWPLSLATPSVATLILFAVLVAEGFALVLVEQRNVARIRVLLHVLLLVLGRRIQRTSLGVLHHSPLGLPPWSWKIQDLR